MGRTLAEHIARGRTAIALARQKGMDTRAWEEQLVELERQELLTWASELAEQELVLPEPVVFVEEPLRAVRVERVSEYSARLLRLIVYARFQQSTGGIGRWLPPWWREREQAAMGALSALREAMGGQRTGIDQ
jgi:hypothetical protein